MIMQFSDKSDPAYHYRGRAIFGQEGSIIVIVLLLLVIMSVIGIASTNTTITENFIVRNTGIRKQNLHMADASAMEVVQRILDAGLTDDPANTLAIDQIRPGMPDCEDWVRPRSEFEGSGNLYDRWYDRDDVGPVLTNVNSEIPLSIQDEVDGIQILNDRGEANGSIRYALVGWAFKASGAGNLNLAAGQPILRTANVLTEYMSERNGIIRLTVGVEREFMN